MNKTYIGARYVPKIEGVWTIDRDYENLSIVQDSNQNSYTSKKDVPIGVDLSNSEYWIKTGNYNAEIDNINSQLNDIPNQSYITEKSKQYFYDIVKDGKADNTGVIDCTNIIKNALLNNKNVYCPPGFYLVSDNITINSNHKLYGEFGLTTLKFNNGGIILGGRYSALKDITILCNDTTVQGGANYGTNNGITISTLDGQSTHFITVERVIIDRFQNAIITSAMMWDCTFKDIRIDYAKIGINFKTTDAISFGIYMERVYCNSCDQCIDVNYLKAHFNCCNFGINNVMSITTSSVTWLVFTECNIECDQQISVAGSLLYLKGNIEFNGCTFIDNTTSAVNFIGVVTIESLLFINCRSNHYTGSGMTDFFSKSLSTTTSYGAIKIIGSPEIPSPAFYDAYLMNFINYDVSPFITLTSTATLANLKIGQMYIYKQSSTVFIPAYYNGTHLVDLTGATLI